MDIKSVRQDSRTAVRQAAEFGSVPDPTYQAALGAAAWQRLQRAVRARFRSRPGVDEVVRYAGTMQRVDLSFMGWLFAQACRLIGTPLAPYRGQHVPMRIELRADPRMRGVQWRRTYTFANAGDITVSSTKCKGTDNEVIEHIGCGFSMRLRLTEENGALVFTSTAYECTFFGKTLQLPALLTPGRTTVRHEQLSGDRFRFSFSVRHPVLGETIFQDGVFYSVSER